MSSCGAWGVRLAASFYLLFLPLVQGGEVVFAYYNLKNYLSMNPSRGDGVSARLAKPVEEVSAIVSMLKAINPDILGVAEIGDQSMLLDFQRRLNNEGMDFLYTEWVQGFDDARHLALLSRYPIVVRTSQSNVPVELNGKRHRMGRGILDATIEIGGEQLRFVGLHLKSRRPVAEYDEAKFRAKEAIAVRGYLDKIFSMNPIEKVFLFGDLNDTKNEFPVKHIAGPNGDPSSLRVIPLLDANGESWTHYWALSDTYSRIDFFMVSKALWPAVNFKKSGLGADLKWRTASDHRPLFTTLSLEK